MEAEYRSSSVHPKKFNLWLLMLSILMLFAGLTSALIVRKGDGNWREFAIPNEFLISTIIVLASSVTMYLAYRAAKSDEIKKMQIFLSITFVLGIAFALSQVFGYYALSDAGLRFINNDHDTGNITGDKISATFFITLAVVHLAHILAGMIFLFFVIIRAFKSQIHKKNTLLIDMCNTYWHFIGLLWVYLYLFLYFAPDF